MTERSHGKLRPSLPRAGELHAVDTVPDPSEGRGPAGRFARGNRLAVDAGQKHAVKKLLGSAAAAGDAELVAKDGLRLLYGALRTSPSDAPVVRTLWALYARHAAVSAFYTAKADAAGLETEAGIGFAELAAQHGARAERLAVTSLDIATKIAGAKKKPRSGLPPWMREVPDDPPAVQTSAIPPREGDEAKETP